MNHSENYNYDDTSSITTTTNTILERSVTVVTAYYRIKSKHDARKYDEWIHNLLLHVGKSCRMVIFTPPELVQYMNAICKKNKKGAAFALLFLRTFRYMNEFRTTRLTLC